MEDTHLAGMGRSALNRLVGKQGPVTTSPWLVPCAWSSRAAGPHVLARGNERRALFVADRDRRPFVQVLAGLGDRHGVLVVAPSRSKDPPDALGSRIPK